MGVDSGQLAFLNLETVNRGTIEEFDISFNPQQMVDSVMLIL